MREPEITTGTASTAWRIDENTTINYPGVLSGCRRADGDFDRGYLLGFKEGYSKVEGQFAVAPICPTPPIPGIGEETFFGGYNQGLIDGWRKQSAIHAEFHMPTGTRGLASHPSASLFAEAFYILTNNLA